MKTNRVVENAAESFATTMADKALSGSRDPQAEAARLLIETFIDIDNGDLVLARYRGAMALLVSDPLVEADLIHLEATRSDQAPCGALVDADQHNDITCPLCFIIHEAFCAKGDDETPFYQWDVDAILADENFMLNAVQLLGNRIAKSKGWQMGSK